MKRKIFPIVAGALAGLGLADPALAQDVVDPTAIIVAETVSGGTGYILNTLLFLIGGFLVMWMAAGFAMLEAGLVRSKNVSVQCLKNIGLYSIAGLMFWVIGYSIAYPGFEGGFIGVADFPYAMQGVGEADTGTGYSVASDWFFQMVFCATTASIVSGAVAERVKLVPFFIFVTVLTGFIYPVIVSWEWGAGWLDAMGFSDFAGSTLVHSTGGWAALMGVLIIGPRLGRYGKDGKVAVFPGSSIPLATLGTFILWLGWFGFNGASQLAMGTVGDVSDVSKIFVNTNMAAAAGVVVAIIATQLRYKKADVTMALNGALAGLVAITAEPLTPNVGMAIVIGGIGGLLPVIFVPILDKLKIDDVVGAIPVHLVAGIWGTLAVPLTNADVPFLAQLIGVVATGIFVSALSAIVWFAIKVTVGVRPSEEEELAGLDIGETGIEAYPEFARASGS
ncbi:ammonium transporter [Qipengyuania sp. DY56-A-20]|uniref:Ammonium transporter n=1 Tax=Qipengyuania benthica TaxID=3067651 RepID=A0ABT9HBM5_9SPHN|nr:ammonium transporter [Qipengyuania sp. DY56-A-20]MBU1253364.1 ammonium transporter [Alphaproteobacteria bacterium]MBU1606077.1 ammonium transporter [Alphaproteobacteria bacterium]MDP4540668.1 ammonium transporter [Qipengyuania sp. DY56-A-20]